MNIIIKVSTDIDINRLAESIAQAIESATGNRCAISVQDNRKMRLSAISNMQTQQKKLLNGR